MRIAFFINGYKEERPRFTTTVLSREALARGHEVFYLGIDDFSFDQRDRMRVRAKRVEKKNYKSLESYLQAIQSEDLKPKSIDVTDIDVLMLRNDPTLDAQERPWAQNTGIVFGQEAARHGVIVLNDPNGLSRALNKLYFQGFPASVRPRTIISRNADELKKFARGQDEKIVLKPLQGSGGQSVFLVPKDSNGNLNQMIEAVRRDGYVIAQEYLPEATKGDVRVFLINGRPLQYEGKFAAIRRTGANGDIRSNMHTGGKAVRVDLTESELEIAELVRPKLVRDGMFFVGLDIVGDKLIEINVFSPGGLYSAGQTQKVKFEEAVIDALERKVQCRESYPGAFDNLDLAVY